MTTTHDVPMPQRFAFISGLINPQDNGTFCWFSDAIAYADARCAKLQAERDRKQKQIHRRANAMNAVYAELQRVAPWSESNDMDWADEMICGIGLLAQERDALAEKVKAMEGNDRRYRWLRDQFETYITRGNRAVAGFFLKDDYEIPDGTVGDRDAKFDAAIDAAGGATDADA